MTILWRFGAMLNAAVGIFVLLLTAVWPAEPSAGQTLQASGDPGVLAVSSAIAGQEPDPVSDASAAYDLLDAEAGSKITGRLDAPLPEGVALQVTLEPPPGASGEGPVTLTTTDQELVILIQSGSYTGLTIEYDFSATVEAGVIPVASRDVVFTVVGAP